MERIHCIIYQIRNQTVLFEMNNFWLVDNMKCGSLCGSLKTVTVPFFRDCIHILAGLTGDLDLVLCKTIMATLIMADFHEVGKWVKKVLTNIGDNCSVTLMQAITHLSHKVFWNKDHIVCIRSASNVLKY